MREHKAPIILDIDVISKLLPLYLRVKAPGVHTLGLGGPQHPEDPDAPAGNQFQIAHLLVSHLTALAAFDHCTHRQVVPPSLHKSVLKVVFLCTLAEGSSVYRQKQFITCRSRQNTFLVYVRIGREFRVLGLFIRRFVKIWLRSRRPDCLTD
jgi:hypothetical protein